MKKSLLRTWLVALLAVFGTASTWALTADLSTDYTLAGYEAKTFYDLTANADGVLPTEGDLRFRDGYGLYNFGSGARSGNVSISVTEGQLLVCQFADTQNRSVTINSISGCTKSTTISDAAGHLFFEADSDLSELTFNVGRAGCVVSILIMEKDASAQTTSYTINYLLNGEGSPVKTVSGEGVVGGTVLTETSFFVEQTKYYRADDAAQSFTLQADGNTFSVNVRLAANFSYNVSSNLGTTLGSGTYVEGEKVYVPYRRYALVDGKFYEAPLTNNEYRVTLTMTADNMTSTVNYEEKEGNVVFYTEGEDIEGMTADVSGNVPVRASNATAATCETDVVITTLPAGKYVFHVGTFTSKSSYADFTINFSIGSEPFSVAIPNVNRGEVASQEFELTAATPLSVLASSSPGTQLDYIWVEKTGDVEVPAIEPAYGEIWSGDMVYPTEGYDAIELSTAYFKDFVKAGDMLRVTLVPQNEARGQRRTLDEYGSLALLANDQSVIAEEDEIEKNADEVEIDIKESYIEQLSTGDVVYLRGQGLRVTKIELIEGTPAEDSELMKEAKELAQDEDAVAVGKLIAAIAEAAETGDESGLQAAIDQFKADNADQEKDQTAKVGTNAWKKFDGTAAGVCATQFAPAITTYDGRTANLAEVYEQTVETTGTIIYQDITGLENGTYKVGFYGNAFYTSGRGFESPMADGAEDVAYVFANDEKEFITANIATSTTENNFRSFDVEVTDGTIKLGMGKEQAGTNWHTMQIYQLTWFTTAKEVFAQDQQELASLLAEAQSQAAEQGEGVDDLNDAIDAAKLAVGSNWYNIEELEEIIAQLQDAIKAYKKANQFIYDGVAYVIDAETGKFMAAGHDWGTRGIVNEQGLDLTFTSDAETRTVTIDTKVSNGGDNHYLGSNLYMDAPAYGWALEYRGFGFYISNGTQYISIDENDNLVLSDQPREWIIVTAEGVKEQRMEDMAQATKENPVDVTWMLQNPNFNRNDQRVAAWTVSEDCTNKNLNGGNNVNNCAESYHSTFTIQQTIADAPKGTYQLTAQGFYRQDDGLEEAAPVFFLNEATAEVPVKTGEEGDMAAASEAFTAGQYTIEPIEVLLTTDGELTVGVKGTATNQWVIFDNFKLTYYGSQATAIDELASDKTLKSSTVYNLQGQKVLNAKKGLYIVDGKKVVLK